MKKKILIVDDSGEQRLKLRILLEDKFYIEEASSGFDALDKLRKIDDIDLIILDVNMPEMSGLEFVEYIVTEDDFNEIPTIMLTTESSPQMKDQVRHCGFVRCWIIKPITKDLLDRAIQRIIGDSGER
mgnify:CR=1 FL=1